MQRPAHPAAESRRFCRLQIALVAALALFGLTDVQRRARVDPLNSRAHKTDLTIFTGAGAAFLADEQPYQFANPRGWKYNYPPLLALLLAPLAVFPFQLQALVWYACSCLLACLAWREAVRISRGFGVDVRLAPENRTSYRRMGWIALAAVLLPGLNCLQRGQVGILNLWLLLWGFRRLCEAHHWRNALAAGVLLALPGVIKLTPALVAITTVTAWGGSQWRSGRRSVATAAAAGLALGGVLFLFVLPGAILGWKSNLGHLQTWFQSVAGMAVEVDPNSALETPFTLRNQSFSNAAYRCGNWISYQFWGGADDRLVDALPVPAVRPLVMESPAAEAALLVVRLLVLLLLAGATWRVVQIGDRRAQVILFGLSCAVSLVVSPLSRGHYFVLLLPAILWIPIWWTAFSARRGGALMALTLPLLVSAHYLWLDVAGRAGLLGLGLTAWAITAAVGMIFDRRGPQSATGPDQTHSRSPDAPRLAA